MAPHPLDVPSFLIRKPGEPLRWKGRKKARKQSEAPPPIKSSPPSLPFAFRLAATEAEEAGWYLLEGIIPQRWAGERDTLVFVNQEMQRRENRKSEALAGLRVRKEEQAAQQPARPPKPKIGEGLVLVVVAKENPRKSGTGAAVRYDAMVAYVKKHAGATVAEVLSNTQYRQDDYLWDLQRGAIKIGEVKK